MDTLDGLTPIVKKESRLSSRELADYLLDLGGTLLSFGCPTYRLESLIRAIAALEGHQAEVFAVPTGVWMSIRPKGETDPGGAKEEPFVRLRRVKEWGVDLARLAMADRIFNDVLERKCDLATARKKIREVEAAPPAYPEPVRWLALAAAAGASAVFFRGGLGEVLAAHSEEPRHGVAGAHQGPAQ